MSGTRTEKFEKYKNLGNQEIANATALLDRINTSATASIAPLQQEQLTAAIHGVDVAMKAMTEAHADRQMHKQNPLFKAYEKDPVKTKSVLESKVWENKISFVKGLFGKENLNQNNDPGLAMSVGNVLHDAVTTRRDFDKAKSKCKVAIKKLQTSCSEIEGKMAVKELAAEGNNKQWQPPLHPSFSIAEISPTPQLGLEHKEPSPKKLGFGR